MKGKNYIIILSLFMLVMAVSAVAEDVTFKLGLPSAEVKVGDTFDVQVLLDVPVQTKSIKSAQFVLTPTSGAIILSATSGSLFTSPTVLFNQQVAGGAYKYGETTAADPAVYGTDKLFVTLRVSADAAGTVTFTFSELEAKKGSFTRTETSTPGTITISAAETCTPRAATCSAAGVSCPGNGVTPIVVCAAGQTCNAAGVCVASTPTCTNGDIQTCSYPVDDMPDTPEEDPGYLDDGTQTCVNGAWGVCGPGCSPSIETCDGVDNNCNTIVDDGATCAAGQTCTNGVCVSTGGTTAERNTWINFYDQNKGKEWTIALISQAARLLRGIFS